ncbi:MAG: hypothetical protein GKR88_02795 [Flavobacteriaceae bacterium]|nr:MAG: hypothetical protein GKR88_02795 [Flavobacteriaceae bacterium]
MIKLNFNSIIVYAFLIGNSFILYSQDRNTFSKGIYQKVDDFKKMTSTDTITTFRIKIGNDTISNRFYRVRDNKRLRKPFAFYDGEHLYVNLKKMIKNFLK